MINSLRSHLSFVTPLTLALVALSQSACTESATAANGGFSALPTQSSQTQGQSSSGGPTVVGESPSIAIASTAFACILEDSSATAEQCQSVAQLASASVPQLRRAEADTVERLSEILQRRSRAERMSPTNRVAFARWFDLAMGAAREAAAARVAAQAANIQRIRRDPELSGDLDALEHAARVDAQALAQRSSLDALRSFAHEGNDGAENATALAVAIIATRLRIAENADQALRSDALVVVADLALESAGPVASRASTAHDGSAANSAAARTERNESAGTAARAALAQMGTGPCSQAIGSIRALCEHSLASVR